MWVGGAGEILSDVCSVFLLELLILISFRAIAISDYKQARVKQNSVQISNGSFTSSVYCHDLRVHDPAFLAQSIGINTPSSFMLR